MILRTPAAFVALGAFALHLFANRGYGYFRDELYYLACADHLDFGYVDHPPLSIAVLWIVRGLIGNSLSALRLVPALCSAFTVLLTGLIARRLGGGAFAQGLAALAVAIGPGHLAVTNFYSMNAIDLLVWAAAMYVFMSALARQRLRDWVLLGIVLGLGLENKFSVMWLGAGLAAALIATPHRRLLLTPGPWLTTGIAALLFLPHVLWQLHRGWPTAEFVRNATELKLADVSPLQFLVDQLLMTNPLTLPIWVAGLWWLFREREGRRWKPVAWTFLTPLAILLVSGTARAYYLGPAYPVVFAAGAVAIAQRSEHAAAWLRPAMVAMLVGGGAITAPLALPLLPVERLIAYSNAIGIGPRNEQRTAIGPLPQHFADMFGWPELVRQVAAVYEALPAVDRDKAVIYADNYGRAGAVDFFGRAHGLPRAVSGHNSYHLWGPRDGSGEVMIIIGGDLEDHVRDFESVHAAAIVRCRYCMPYEDNVTIFVARRLRQPLARLWPSVKRYI